MLGEEVYGSAIWDCVGGFYVFDYYFKIYMIGFFVVVFCCDVLLFD